MSRTFLATALAAAGLVVAHASAHADVERSRGEIVMGTTLRITVAATSAEIADDAARRVIAIARHWDDVLTTWRPDGELARLNASAGRGPVSISNDLRAALETMLLFSAETAGAFDPAVGAAVKRYATDPKATDLQRGAPMHDALSLAEGSASLRAGTEIDAGGIGKGIALDTAAAELRTCPGITGAYFDFGGSSILAFGRRADGSSWTLGLAGMGAATLRGVIALDRAVSTSQTRPAGDETGPIVDPATGGVVANARFVTCLSESATRAEAWSTALVVSGHDAIDSAEQQRVEVLYEEPSRFPAPLRSLSLARRIDAGDPDESQYVSTAEKKIKR